MSREIKALTGDDAVAYAAKVVNPDVVAAYPITPQTIIVEKFSEFVNDGEVDTEFVPVESEHSAMSACVGSSTAGARVFTSSASQGILLMYEILYIASSSRLPIVMAVANRAISAPINIHGELSDELSFRDSGWIQFYSESSQEAYDHTIMAFKIGEDNRVLLPVAVGLDGFIITHALERVELLSRDEVSKFLGGERQASLKLDYDNPVTFSLLALQDYYMEARYQVVEALEKAKEVIRETFAEWEKLTGRSYKPVETYQMDDAEFAFITMGAFAGNARTAVDELRAKGEKVGMIKIRVHRPFFTEEIAEACQNLKGLISVERAHTYGGPGFALAQDVKSALYYSKNHPNIAEYCAGLGGRDVLLPEWFEIYEEAKATFANGNHVKSKWWGVRE
jgi:pyruvate ferredoxin oxidoreductase alpha subunit